MLQVWSRRSHRAFFPSLTFHTPPTHYSSFLLLRSPGIAPKQELPPEAAAAEASLEGLHPDLNATVAAKWVISLVRALNLPAQPVEAKAEAAVEAGTAAILTSRRLGVYTSFRWWKIF